MEKRHIKRLPVVRGKQVVGIVSRANLLQALVSVGQEVKLPVFRAAFWARPSS
jgi:signal-transduction protein with cAMP-binding, CBS, and nucleotidyltransferase domain